MYIRKKQTFIRLIFAAASAVLMWSCETGIQINTDNQDVPIVYCVLNSADSFQYVRIQRTYLTDQSAFDYTPDPDSMLFKGEIVVSLERWSEGKVMETVRFAPTTEIPKDPVGLFPSEKNIIYKAKIKILSNQTYRLYIYLGSKEKVLYSQITSLGNLTVIDPVALTQRKISLYPGNNYTCQWEPVKNAGVYQVAIRFYYRETANGVGTEKYIDWPQLLSSPGNDAQYLSNDISGSRFMHILQDRIDPVSTLRDTVREVVGLSFQIIGGSEEMRYYIESTSPSEGALMEKPVYSNITNGIGLFCSVARINVNELRLSAVTIDSIAYGQFTRNLGFLDHTGDRDSTNRL